MNQKKCWLVDVKTNCFHFQVLRGPFTILPSFAAYSTLDSSRKCSIIKNEEVDESADAVFMRCLHTEFFTTNLALCSALCFPVLLRRHTLKNYSGRFSFLILFILFFSPICYFIHCNS